MEDLIVKAKNGDKEAFEDLILSIKSDLYKIAKAKLSNEEDAKDAVQATILKAYINIGKLKEIKYFKTWIIRIAINQCNTIYRNNEKNLNLIEKSTRGIVEEEISDEIEVDLGDIIRELDEKEKTIFELYYKENLSIKEISKILAIKTGTIKSVLSRGRTKLRGKLKSTYLIIFILCVIFTTGVAATCIINYIKNSFSTVNAGIENSGILAAIENKEWFQEINMEYIELDKKNKIKINYLLLDEMSLYLVIDFESQEDISEYSDVFFTDLIITNEKGEKICDLNNILRTDEAVSFNNKPIEKDKHNIKDLIFIYSEEIPSSKTLNISFSKVRLADYSSDIKEINKKVNFKIDLIDKFANREVLSYTSMAKEIEKSVITETGFYAIVSLKDSHKIDAKLIDERGKNYACESFALSYDNRIGGYKNMIISDFDNKENKKIKLIINDKEYKLNKIE